MALSSQIATTVYMVAVIGLAVLLARPVYLVYSGSQERGAQIVAAGMATLLDSMSPGSSVVTELDSYPGVPVSVVLGGSTLTAHVGGSSASYPLRWGVEGATLTSGARYNFTLEGGEIAVSPARDG